MQYDERYFNIDQRNQVEENIDELVFTNFVELPRAIVKESEFTIGNSILKCSVLNDGRRVIKDKSLFNAIDRTRKGETRIEGFPPIIGSKILANLFNELYPENIEIIAPFDVAQFNGKTALIDEATNYQNIREKDELQLLLATFISEELRPYSKEFPKEYFENLFRIYGLPYDPTSQKRPRFFAQFNIKYVYEMLPPQVWSKLDEINPTIWHNEKQYSSRKYHIHRHLTDEGLRYLKEHLQSLIPVMKLSNNKEDFIE